MTRKRHWLQQYKYKKGHTYQGPIGSSEPVPSAPPEAPARPWLPRLTQKDYDLVVKKDPQGNPSLPDCEGVCSGAKLLRPKKSPECVTEKNLEGDGSGENRLLHKDKNTNMWNMCIKEHIEMKNTCKLPQFKVCDEKQKGLCWSQALRCTNCKYKSNRFKLYEEVKSNSRGPKYAKANLALQAGLQECAIGNYKARVLLLSTNTPAPSRSGMQKAANRVAILSTEAAEADLAERLRNLNEISKARNNKDSSINIKIDTRYNTNRVAVRGKFGQSATQALGIAIEGHTDQKQIIAVCLENKLCQKGALLRAKGERVSCPGGHDGCTATRQMPAPFSEHDIGKKLAEDIIKQNVKIKFVTTDGDSRSSQGVAEAMNIYDPTVKVTRLADTTHLAQSLFRKANKAPFSDTMFAAPTKEERNEQQKMFSLDLMHRCHKIYKTMFANFAGNISEIGAKMPAVIDTTIQCYEGNCVNCKKSSIVCKGGKKSWTINSENLKPCSISYFHMTESDKDLLRDVMNFYLGKDSLDLIKFNTNTNKNEAANRAISSSLAKNVRYSRNAKARALSAVCRLNKGAGIAMSETLAYLGCQLSKGGRVAYGMHRVQCEQRYNANYSKSESRKRARLHNKISHMRDYFRCKQLRKQGDYLKRQLDPPLKLRHRKAKHDHNYCERPFVEVSDHRYSAME